MMQKKKFIFGAAAVLALLVAVNSTLAFFTDTDAKDNTFTSGNVKIQLLEQERTSAEDDTLVDFKPNKPLIPYTGTPGTNDLSRNYVDKIVNVKNTGLNDAYVCVFIAVPEALDKALHLDLADTNWDVSPVPMSGILIDNVRHVIYSGLYRQSLPSGEQTVSPVMHGLYLDPEVDYREDKGGYILNGEPLGFDLGKVEIPVLAQAVQADGFKNSAEAFNAARIPMPDNWQLQEFN